MNYNRMILCIFLFQISVAKANSCLDSIKTNKMSSEQTSKSITVDISHYFELDKLLEDPAKILANAQAVNIECNVDTLYPPSKSPDTEVTYVPVWGAIIDDIGWVIYLSSFTNEQLNDSINGVALSAVTFDKNGNILDTIPLSTFSQHEGVAEKSYSEINDDRIITCTQRVDFYEYDDDGAITGTLKTPKYSQCNYEYYKIQQGLFKVLNVEWQQ